MIKKIDIKLNQIDNCTNGSEIAKGVVKNVIVFQREENDKINMVTKILY